MYPLVLLIPLERACEVQPVHSVKHLHHVSFKDRPNLRGEQVLRARNNQNNTTLSQVNKRLFKVHKLLSGLFLIPLYSLVNDKGKHMASSVSPQLIHQPEVHYSTARKWEFSEEIKTKEDTTFFFYIFLISLCLEKYRHRIHKTVKKISTPSPQRLITHWMGRNL